MKKFLSSLILSFTFLSAGSALAADALTTANVNLRTGPSTRYGIQAKLPAGFPIAIIQCANNWCNVFADGYRGWLSANYVAFGPTRQYLLRQNRVIDAPPIVRGDHKRYYRQPQPEPSYNYPLHRPAPSHNYPLHRPAPAIDAQIQHTPAYPAPSIGSQMQHTPSEGYNYPLNR